MTGGPTLAGVETGEGCEGCDDHGPGHYGSTSNDTTSKPWNGAASRFSDDEYKMATAACDSGDGTVKSLCFLPHHEPDGTVNVNGVHAAAQRVSSLKGHDAAAVSRAKAHLRSHYKAMNEDPPEAIAAAAISDDLAAGFAGMHDSYTGSHKHAHSAYGQQGGDAEHDHTHTHDGDNLHRHSHADATVEPVTSSGADARRAGIPFAEWVGGWWAGQHGSFRRQPPAGRETWWNGVIEGLAYTASGRVDHDPMLGAEWAITEHEPGEWFLLTAGGTPWNTTPIGSYTEALEALSVQLAEQGDSRATLDNGWQSEMAFEGVSTGDGRYILPGAIEYRATPLPLMLQTETETGHMGAVLAGAINGTGKLGQIALGTGDYDRSPAGQQAFSIVDARGRFGVSIDVAEAEGQPHCNTHNVNPMDSDDCDYDCDIEAQFSLIKVMGLTMTPFPAFEDAYIANKAPAAANQTPPAPAVAASGEGCAECAEQMAEGLAAAATQRPARPATATVPDVDPPAEWFENPGFRIGDGRLVLQPDDMHYACPLTVEEPDAHGRRRVYGHMASWFTCHTGIRNQCVTAPRSKSGYAAFNLRPIQTEDGTIVKVGHLTMGIGHADTDPSLSFQEVAAHYDGGPGAIRMARVRMGEDEFGPWFAGCIAPGVTEEQVRAFSACSVSGDWREVFKGKGLDCVACLAGVTVPGFPITASASALTLTAGRPEVRVGWRGNDPVALVAAGSIAQPQPWERQLGVLTAANAELTRRLEAAEHVVDALRPLAAEKMIEAMQAGRG